MSMGTNFDMSGWGIPSATVAPSAPVSFGSIAMDGDEYVRCGRCGFSGCDLRVSGCGCTLHTVRRFVLGFT
jgi:hypothetical protein